MDNKLLEELKQIIINRQKDILINIEYDNVDAGIDAKLKSNGCRVTVNPEYWRFEQGNADVWVKLKDIKEVTYIEHPYDKDDESCQYEIVYGSGGRIEFVMSFEDETKLPFGD